MRLHAILCVRDEGDVIAQTMAHLLSWTDALYVYDTGSTDGTWEIVRDAASRDARVVLIGHEDVVFHGGVRAWVFDRIRGGLRRGDWVARVDADEFYHVDPREFIRARVRAHEHVVCAQLYDFILLRREVRAWREGRETTADRARPIEERRRHYIINTYPEIRLFRYRSSLRWPQTSERPLGLGAVARERIPVRHYRWRDPAQAEARIALRRAIAPRMLMGGAHWTRWELREFVRRANARGVHEYTPERGLIEVRDLSHLEGSARRALLLAVSRCGLLRWCDARLGGIDPAWTPEAGSRGERADICVSLVSG